MANGEKINFITSLKELPSRFIYPSNLMHKVTIEKLYNLFNKVIIKDPNFKYPNSKILIDEIDKLNINYPVITQENYLEIKDKIKNLRKKFILFNVDDIANITNIAALKQMENQISILNKTNKQKSSK